MTPVHRYRAAQLRTGDIVTLDGHAVLVLDVMHVCGGCWLLADDWRLYEMREDAMVVAWKEADDD